MTNMAEQELPWPTANAQVGDAVWYRADPLTDWQTDWHVAAVGVTVTEGQRFDIEIKRAGEDKGLIVSPFPPAQVCPYEGMARDRAQILVMPKPPPSGIQRILGKYPDLLAVRSGNNGDGCRLRLLCRRCWCWLIVVSTTVTTGELEFEDSDADGRFSECCTDLMSSETRVSCGCDHAVYAIRFTSVMGIEEGTDEDE